MRVEVETHRSGCSPSPSAALGGGCLSWLPTLRRSYFFDTPRSVTLRELPEFREDLSATGEGRVSPKAGPSPPGIFKLIGSLTGDAVAQSLVIAPREGVAPSQS